MAELVPLNAEPAPGPDVAERLAEVNELVAKGDVSSIAIAVVHRDGTASRWFSTPPSWSLLIGATARLEAALIREADLDG